LVSRPERAIDLAEKQEVPTIILAYMNRLSDLLFVLAGLVNRRAGAKENTW